MKRGTTHFMRITLGLVVALSCSLTAFEWRESIMFKKTADIQISEPIAADWVPTKLPDPPAAPKAPKVSAQEITDIFKTVPDVVEPTPDDGKKGENKGKTGVDVPLFDLDPETPEDEPFNLYDLDEYPVFPGCENCKTKDERALCLSKKMNEFLKDHIRFDEACRTQASSGKIVIQFVIDKSGNIAGAQILSGLGFGCDETALETMNSLPEMKPGKVAGKPVNVRFNLPIRVSLN